MLYDQPVPVDGNVLYKKCFTVSIHHLPKEDTYFLNIYLLKEIDFFLCVCDCMSICSVCMLCVCVVCGVCVGMCPWR